MQAHEAHITVRSEPGKGTEFTLLFRQAEVPNSLAAPPPELSKPTAPAVARKAGNHGIYPGLR